MQKGLQQQAFLFWRPRNRPNTIAVYATGKGISHSMQQEQLKYWLALIRVPGLGPITFQKLRENLGNPQAIIHTKASRLEALGIPTGISDAIRNPDWGRVEQDLEWLQAAENHAITLEDPQYPVLLREIDSAPPVLFVHGKPEVLGNLQLAMVGSRNPTRPGARCAHDFACHLAQAGLAITSGLALGIDTACHQGALDGGGITIAVTGTGLDRVYPAKNRELAYKIAENGALVSEFPPGTPSRAENFPRRNRIISGLSLGTLVVEAALKSGSLITARLAIEQGREVFAIPGSIHNPLARGCHYLIRQGAKLVETADDILSELGALAAVGQITTQATETTTEITPELDQDYIHLLENMGHEPVSVDALIQYSGLTAEEVSSMLLILELQGIVASGPGGTYIRMK